MELFKAIFLDLDVGVALPCSAEVRLGVRDQRRFSAVLKKEKSDLLTHPTKRATVVFACVRTE